jgi:4-carboxymuconolactone decarboxylase
MKVDCGVTARGPPLLAYVDPAADRTAGAPGTRPSSNAIFRPPPCWSGTQQPRHPRVKRAAAERVGRPPSVAARRFARRRADRPPLAFRRITPDSRGVDNHQTGGRSVANAPVSPRERLRGTFPKLIDLADKVVYGDIWERPGLSKRDRSLIVVATLIATYRPEQLRGHLGRALDNGVTRDEIGEIITHLAFYAGWPASMTAARIATEIFEERGLG